MPPKNNLTGRVFGKLTVIEEAGRARDGAIMWRSRCECGGWRTCDGWALKSGATRSCGCLLRDARPATEPEPVNGARWIALTRGKWTLVDESDYGLVARHSWFWLKGYAAAHMPEIRKAPVTLHRFLLPGIVEIDHVNRDPLDNRRANLRPCDRSENNANGRLRRDSTSGFRGVSRKGSGWCAEVSFKGNRYRRGGFTTPEAAARARDLKAIELHGEFVRLNFPELAEAR